MPTPTKPSVIPVWATTKAIQPSGDGSTGVTTPPASYLNNGWGLSGGKPERPPFEYFNWQQKLNGEWLTFVDAWIGIEHADDGTHTDITADTVLVSDSVTAQGNIVSTSGHIAVAAGNKIFLDSAAGNDYLQLAGGDIAIYANGVLAALIDSSKVSSLSDMTIPNSGKYIYNSNDGSDTYSYMPNANTVRFVVDGNNACDIDVQNDILDATLGLGNGLKLTRRSTPFSSSTTEHTLNGNSGIFAAGNIEQGSLIQGAYNIASVDTSDTAGIVVTMSTGASGTNTYCVQPSVQSPSPATAGYRIAHTRTSATEFYLVVYDHTGTRLDPDNVEVSVIVWGY